jgi:hypothetical protein
VNKEQRKIYDFAHKEERKARGAARYIAKNEEIKAWHRAYAVAYPELLSVRRHYNSIFNPRVSGHQNYKDMPFFDGWNPDKGGSHKAGVQWIIDNIGKRPDGYSLHVVRHDIGFMPGNLEWATPKKQTNQQMYKVIAQQHHQIKILKRQLIEAQQVFALVA